MSVRYVIESQAGPRWAFIASHSTLPAAAQALLMFEERYPDTRFAIHRVERHDVTDTARTIPTDHNIHEEE
jgi:hypothetical protein